MSDSAPLTISEHVDALLNQYIAEAQREEKTKHEFVDLEDLVRSTFEENVSNSQPAIINSMSFGVPLNLDAFIPARSSKQPVYQQASETQQLLDDPSIQENMTPKYLPLQPKPKMSRKHNEKAGKPSVASSIMKPKRGRESRARQFFLEEIFCFNCKIKFKKPQSLISHLHHRHGQTKRMTLRI